jgi:hypothetical protein
MNDKANRLTDLPRAIEPPRDLWPQLAARIATEGAAKPSRSLRWPMALAAGLVMGLIGLAVGRFMLPQAPQLMAPAPATAGYGEFLDARYLIERDRLSRAATERLAKLPPADRAKVELSIKKLREAVDSIQQALGAEPANALLQELLVSACQNEMQALSELNRLETML